jgi:DNA-binding NarL/FixJ family response regulator
MRVIIADDSILFREGLTRILTAVGFEVVDQVADAEQLMQRVRLAAPELVIIDIRMPPTHTTEGLMAAHAIRLRHPRVGILVLSQYVETQHVVGLIADGAKGIGYLLKDRVSDLGEFSEAVRRVGGGGSVIDPEVVYHLVNRQRRRSMLDELTDRERQVLALMAEGRSNQSIAERLFLSGKTVEVHVRNIFLKFDLPVTADDHRRVLAVITYLRANTTTDPRARNRGSL